MISFITTVLNEENSINDLLCSLLAQSRLPDEVIIVDGGSQDKTRAIIKKYQRNSPFQLVLLTFPGVNRSVGRNLAIKNSRGKIIAGSDVGCCLDKNWIKEITRPFSFRKIDVVAGYYLPVGSTPLQKLLGLLTSVSKSKIKPDRFLPSSRSIAFRRSAWEKIGGYPENLNYCEDLVFCRRLKMANKKFDFAPRAIVFWPQRKSISSALKQFFNYAVGDGMAGREGPHYKKLSLRIIIICTVLLLIVQRPFWFYPFVFLFTGYFFYRSILLTFRSKVLTALPLALLILPLVNFVVVAGFIYGSILNLKQDKTLN